ncbi:PHD-finger [Teratosphaeria destructans]|uniref:PHD-finger n=1 Tax=Teratosphaeria destructans TaxID=418781 RepID=A0A9W7W2Z7_9PEZI|nr:PHD-finger [Teratosphaeria destructans]
MPSAHPRQTRETSRASTPNTKGHATQDKTAGKKEPKDKTFMDQWVEPAVQRQASYQDHNGSAHGVLEHMQPLGEAPSVKVRSKTRPRKSCWNRDSATADLEGEETPKGTPAPQSTTTPEVKASVQPHKPPPPVIDDEKDADYAPVTKKKAPSGRGRPPGKVSAASKKDAENAIVPTTNKKRKYDAPKLKLVVESAQNRAHQVGKPDLAEAVHEIWRESLNDTRLTDLLEAILTQAATAEQTAEFQVYVRKAKRRLRLAKGQSRTLPAEGANGTPALPLRSPSKSVSQAADAQRGSAIPSTEPPEVPRSKTLLKLKQPYKDPTERRKPAHKGKASVSPQKKRELGYDSDSSLTDLTEDADDGMDVDEQDELAAGPSKASNRMDGLKGKDHAAERGSLTAPDHRIKRTSADADLDGDEREREIAAKKQKLSKDIKRGYAFQVSDMRQSTKGSELRNRPLRGNDASLVPPPLSLQPNGSRAVSAALDSPLSELSGGSSRLSTPQAYGGPPTKAPPKRAKTKTSPEKKQQAGLAGLVGAGGAGKDSPIGDDDNEELSENNDFCSACGGSGFLLCCDGCDRSFHFQCLDPPISEEASELNEPWYCYICVAKRPVAAESPEKPSRGLFAPLMNGLKKRNPSNFALPESIRNYYENVHTDKNGNFTDVVVGKTSRRAGYDEAPDYTKLKDAKGNTVLCYYCGKSSLDRRLIIQCDHCPHNWHLDCLDPPLANPPARTWDNKKLHDWMCPLHAEHELRKVDTALLVPRRRIHLRRPKDARIVDTSLNRGFVNNGVVDIEFDESDDSGSEFYDEQQEPEGAVYRLPSSGVKLDFIDKVKKARMSDAIIDRAPKRARLAPAPPSALQQANFARRSFAEQQLALNLAQFAAADGNKDLDLGKDKMNILLGTLIAEAPQEVVSAKTAEETVEAAKSSAAAIPPSPPSSEQTDQLSAEQRRELENLQELIRRKLDQSKS